MQRIIFRQKIEWSCYKMPQFKKNQLLLFDQLLISLMQLHLSLVTENVYNIVHPNLCFNNMLIIQFRWSGKKSILHWWYKGVTVQFTLRNVFSFFSKIGLHSAGEI